MTPPGGLGQGKNVPESAVYSVTLKYLISHLPSGEK